MTRPYRYIERKVTPKQRARFLADMAGTAPYLEPITIGRWVNTPTRREKRRARKARQG
jgi:hypothetical protein